jgi:AhpC/TSA family
MTLKEQLERHRAASRQRMPPDVQEALHQATEALRDSGILTRVLRAGDRAPDFTLPNAHGVSVTFAGLRARGPVVLSFFRGKW